MIITRRALMGSTLALAASGCIPPDQSPIGRLAAQLRLIEAAELGSAGGILGVQIYEPDSGVALGINQDRRFGHASSFKFTLAAMLLAQHAAGTINADKRVTWSEADMAEHAPFTRARMGTGASLRELAEAAQKTSDNTAANILMREMGGPAAVTGFWRSLGDEVSRIDRYEPDMNLVPESEFRDTTTPAAMARTVAQIIYGDVLPAAERAQLKQWMIDTETGLRRVRAGLPADWVAGDKTGTSGLVGQFGTYVDIGFVEPTKARPVLTFAAYYRARQGEDVMQERAERVLMRVGRVIREFVERDRPIPVPNMFRQI
ncbi:MAG: class A beta-lactamase [Erythrobacter sp.]